MSLHPLDKKLRKQLKTETRAKLIDQAVSHAGWGEVDASRVR